MVTFHLHIETTAARKCNNERHILKEKEFLFIARKKTKKK